MTYPQHWLLAFGGTSGDPLDIWSCNIRMAIFDSLPWVMDEEQYLTATAVPALTTWFSNPNSKIATAAILQWVKFNEIGPDGKYADPSVTHERLGLNVVGGTNTTDRHPLQCACVLSWRTNAAERGPASKGRIYSPRPAVVIQATGDVTGADRTSIAGTAKTLIESLDATLGPLGNARIYPSIVSNIGSGVAHRIDSIVVDSALDIQRRRANKQSREGTTVVVA